jgi:hypothetical protein
LQSVLITISIAFITGIFISYFYMITYKTGVYSQNFLLTLVMLPTIIALIILLIGSNLARAFSLAGVFSIIRFRTSMGNPKDIAYIFFTVAVGLALGTGFIGYAVLFAVVLCAFMYLLCRINFGQKKNVSKKLRILMPEDLDYESVFDDIFYKYTNSHIIKRTKTTDLGSLYELTYDISLKKGVSEKKFIDELRCRNGNLTISISTNEEEY